MLSKVILLYRDIDLQKRWISEVNALTKIPRGVIEHYAEEKRKKWKNFRE